MKTLILEPDSMRARAWVALYGNAVDDVHVARSAAQARLMLISGSYDRLCLRMDQHDGSGFALLSVARSVNAECEIVDLTSRRVRTASGPMEDPAIPSEPLTP
ncbi:MAG: hypothetical protein RIB61_08570 [Roseicyclus sp.]